jgi:Tfp pilus assembly protein PilP
MNTTFPRNNTLLNSILLPTVLALSLSSNIAVGGTNSPALEPTPEPTPNPTSRYNPQGRPDPFKPIPLTSAAGSGRLDLVSTDTRDIRLVGTALGSELSALLSIGDKGVIARVGDKIGKAGGRIVAISKDRIVVRQPTMNTGVSNNGAAKSTSKRYEDTVIRITGEEEQNLSQTATTSSEVNTNSLGIDSSALQIAPSTHDLQERNGNTMNERPDPESGIKVTK